MSNRRLGMMTQYFSRSSDSSSPPPTSKKYLCWMSIWSTKLTGKMTLWSTPKTGIKCCRAPAASSKVSTNARALNLRGPWLRIRKSSKAANLATSARSKSSRSTRWRRRRRDPSTTTLGSISQGTKSFIFRSITRPAHSARATTGLACHKSSPINISLKGRKNWCCRWSKHRVTNQIQYLSTWPLLCPKRKIRSPPSHKIRRLKRRRLPLSIAQSFQKSLRKRKTNLFPINKRDSISRSPRCHNRRPSRS